MAKGLSSVKAETLILPEWEDAGEEECADLLELAKQAGVSCVFAGEGDRLSFKDVEMCFLAPLENASGADANEEGLVMELRYRAFRGLFYRRYRGKRRRGNL